MTKQEALSEIMYTLKFHDNADFEVDEESYSIERYKDSTGWFRGWKLYHSIKEPILYDTKTELKKAIAKLGKQIIVL